MNIQKRINELLVQCFFLLIILLVFQQIETSFKPAGFASGDSFSNSAQFPKIVAWCMLAIVILLFLKNVLEFVKEWNAQSTNKQTLNQLLVGCLSRLKTLGNGKLLLSAVAIWLYVLFIDNVGYILATPLLLITLALIFGERRPVLLILYPAVLTALVFGLFQGLLHVVLPVSQLPFLQ